MSRINSQTMKYNNIRMILNAIRKNGPISRIDLAKNLGLTAPAVSKIVSTLIQSQLLAETGYSDSAAGRKPILLSINPDVCYVLGMVFTLEEITVAITDFAANILWQERRCISALQSKDEILALLIDCAHTCLRKLQVQASQVLGLGIAAPGPLDQEKGLLINPPNFPDWKNVPICSIMEDALGIPAVLDKETNAAALGEYYLGTPEEFRAMFYILLLSNSIGGSVMYDGNILHGFEDGAGDIGHSLVDINGPACACGQYGCLERVASGNALVNEAKARLKSMNNMNLPVPCDAESIQLEDIFAYSKQGIRIFEDIVDYVARMIATAIGNVISILSPSRVVIGGPLGPLLLDRISSYIQSRSYPSCAKRISITPAALGESACVRGAVMLALDTYQTKLCAGEIPAD